MIEQRKIRGSCGGKYLYKLVEVSLVSMRDVPTSQRVALPACLVARQFIKVLRGTT